MRRRLLLVSLLLALAAPAAARAADPAYADPAQADELAELLRAEWPNRFSKAEDDLPPDSPVRAALWRARVAAKALPQLTRGGEIRADASGRFDLTVRVTRRTPAGQPIDDRIIDFGPEPAFFSLRSSATAAAAPYGGVWVWFAGPLGDHPPGYPQFDVWYFYIQTEQGRIHAARDMPNCIWGKERSPDINCLEAGTNQIAREQALYDSLLAQPVGDVLWNGRYCEPNYFPGFWDPVNKVKCLTRLTTHDRFVRELPAAYFVDNDGRPIDRTVSWTVPATLDVPAAVESLEGESPDVVEWLDEAMSPRRTLIFVPGVAGSRLTLDLPLAPDAPVWPDAVLFGGQIEFLDVSDDGNTPAHTLEASAVLGDAFTKTVYGDALGAFRQWEAEGYLEEFVPFPYDWRLGVGSTAPLLAEEIERRCDEDGALWIVTHSTGGLVLKQAAALLAARIDLQQCLGAGGVVLLAAPHLGAPKAIGSVVNPDRFFGSIVERSLAHEEAFARVINNWSTVWDLMPAPGVPGRPHAREQWFDDRADGGADLNVAGVPLNTLLDQRSLSTRGHWYGRDVFGDARVFNVFGVGTPTPGSYRPGRCFTNLYGVETLRDLETNATLDLEDDGDETVPAWSAVWPSSGLLEDAQYAIWGVKHGRIPGNDKVLELLRSIVGSRIGYPSWPFPSGSVVRGRTAVDAANAAAPANYKTTSCSPVHMVATYAGAEVGVRPDGTYVKDVPTGLVETAGPANDPQETIVIAPDAVSAPPVYTLTAFLPGPVSIWHREPDGSKHDFRFDVEFGDRALLRKESGEWRLSIDRGGDGDYDEVLAANHPYVSLRGSAGTIPAGAPAALSVDAAAQIAGALDFAWELVSGEGELVGTGEDVVFVPEDGPDEAVVRVTVTDAEGASATDEIELLIANSPPRVDAGGDASAPWGVPVPFAGTATDASADVEAGLSFGWDFGDGTSGNGPDQLHAYANPGAYRATLTAADRDGGTGSDSRLVTITRRGATLAVPDAMSTFGNAALRLRLVDDVAPESSRLAGRNLHVRIDDELHDAVLNSNGEATILLDHPPAPGSHAIRVELAPDALYTAEPLETALRIVNGYGDVEGAARYDSDARAAFAVHSGPDQLSGQIEYRSADRVRLHSGNITAFGIVDGAAWFAGIATDGRHFVARAEPGSFGLWIDGRLEPNATVEAGAIHVRPA